MMMGVLSLTFFVSKILSFFLPLISLLVMPVSLSAMVFMNASALEFDRKFRGTISQTDAK